MRKLIHEKAKKATVCPHCGETNGIIKKSGSLKISYEKYRNWKGDNPSILMKLGKIWLMASEVLEESAIDETCFTVSAELDEAVEKNKEMDAYRRYILIRNLNPQDVLSLFEVIRLEDIPLLMMRPEISSPKDLILTRIAVPPICIRPSVISEVKAGT
jgi:DNA-directed RNA polymerase III subunit RPC1